jgi:AraC-like DNA-binding protein
MTQVFETTDPEVASELFRSQYTSMRMQIQGRQPLLRFAFTHVGRARLDRSTFRMALDGNADPLEQVSILRVLSGTVRYTCGDSEEAYGPGDTCYPLPTGRAWAGSVHDLDSELVVLDPALLDETAGTPPDAKAPVRLLSNRPQSKTAVAQLWRTAEFVRISIADEPETGSPSLVTSSAARLLAAVVLATFPSTARTDPTIEDRHDAHPDTLRRAIAYIETNPGRDIGVADIAAAAFVTVRAVQLAFRRHLDTTPMAYLRRVRLSLAHDELRTTDPGDGHTVTSIAARWGFANASRFAQLYREEFNQLPSRTLRT